MAHIKNSFLTEIDGIWFSTVKDLQAMVNDYVGKGSNTKFLFSAIKKKPQTNLQYLPRLVFVTTPKEKKPSLFSFLNL